jgi:transposase
LSGEDVKRGKKGKSKAMNFLECLDIYRAYVLAFAFNEEVPFTNNFAERGLRPLKSHDKSRCTFKNLNSAQGYIDLMGYLDSCRKNGIIASEALLAVISKEMPDFITEWLKLSPVNLVL